MYTEMNDEFAFARPYLAPGETILWRGKPEKGHLLSGKDVLLIPFGIFYCGFAIFWTVSALTVAPLPFAMFGVPFICVGLYITIGRSIHTASVRKRTVYVITNQKILRRRGNKIDMLDAKTMPAIHVTAPTAPVPSSSGSLPTTTDAATDITAGVPTAASSPWKISPMWPESSISFTPSPEIKIFLRCNP